MKKRLMVLAMAGIMVTGLVSSANIVSADDKEASGLEGKRIGVCLVYKGDEWCAAVADEFEKQAKDLGVDVNIQACTLERSLAEYGTDTGITDGKCGTLCCKLLNEFNGFAALFHDFHGNRAGIL